MPAAERGVLTVYEWGEAAYDEFGGTLLEGVVDQVGGGQGTTWWWLHVYSLPHTHTRYHLSTNSIQQRPRLAFKQQFCLQEEAGGITAGASALACRTVAQQGRAWHCFSRRPAAAGGNRLQAAWLRVCNNSWLSARAALVLCCSF